MIMRTTISTVLGWWWGEGRSCGGGWRRARGRGTCGGRVGWVGRFRRVWKVGRVGRVGVVHL